MELLGLIFSGMQYGSKLLYIDPAATSVLLSSCAAIAVAIAASAIIIWKKVKNNVKKIIKTDPNKNKEVEKDVVLVDEEALNADNTVKESQENAEDTKVDENDGKEADSDDKTPEEQVQNQENINSEDKK